MPLPLTRSWCATWFALTRRGGLDVIGSVDSFLIVFHALRLLYILGYSVNKSTYIVFIFN